MKDSNPSGSPGFSARADRRLVRARGRSRRFVRVELRAPEAPPRDERLPVRLSFVLDRSGSMAGSKIEKARRAIIQGIRSLSSQDRFSVVVYDDEVDVIVRSTHATPENRGAAERAVKKIGARGCTDLCGGWLRGCEQAGLELENDAVGRCLLLTDGIANEGITNHTEIIKHARALRDRRVATSTFGVGADFDEKLLRLMAEAGGGNFHFIETAQQIPDFIAQEVGETLKLTARDVGLVVVAGAGSAVDSLNGFPCRRLESGFWRIEIGALFSGRIIDPVIGIRFPPGGVGAQRRVTVRVEDEDGVFEEAVEQIRFEWASDGAVEAQERDHVVERRVVELTAARAYQEALERNQAGDYAGARRVLDDTSASISSFAEDNPATLGTLAQLRLQSSQVAGEMDSLARKRGYTESYGTLTSRPVSQVITRPSRNVVLLPAGDIRSVVDAAVPHLAAADPELFGDMVLDGRLSRHLDSHKATDLMDLEEAFKLSRLASNVVPEAGIRIVFTTRPLDKGSSSHWDSTRRTAIVSLAQLQGSLRAAPQALVAAEVVFYALHLVGPGYTPGVMGHQEARGCVYDAVRSAESIEKTLEGNGLCPECLQRLSDRRLPTDRLFALHAAVKELAGGSTVVH